MGEFPRVIDNEGETLEQLFSTYFKQFKAYKWIISPVKSLYASYSIKGPIAWLRILDLKVESGEE